MAVVWVIRLSGTPFFVADERTNHASGYTTQYKDAKKFHSGEDARNHILHYCNPFSHHDDAVDTSRLPS